MRGINRTGERRAGLSRALALTTAPTLFLIGFAALPHRATGDADAAPTPTPEQAEFFEKRVRPVLADNCLGCHGKDAQMGNLRLDSRAALLKGGDSGASLVPGDPEKSLLVRAVRHVGSIQMPKGGKLKDDEIAALADWVKMGAPWPDTTVPAKAVVAAVPGGGRWGAWQKFWSFQPVKKPAVPVVKHKDWVRSPIDSFVLAKLEAKGLAPAAPADKRTLLRRVTFDLTGLPPTPAEMQAFLVDKSPNVYDKVVDRLLASPRYGEYWGRHWLDVARYADTKGYVFNEDRNYYNAYTYRDWVIRAFNDDLPYDQFILQQLAADRLPGVQNADDKRPLAALGFLTVGRRFLNQQPDIIDDRIDVTMRGFQGLTVGCARCHDHKFDPIPTQDYYSLYGVFNSSTENAPPISPKNVSDPWLEHNRKVEETQGSINGIITAQVKRLREMMKDPVQAAKLSDPVKGALQAVREEEMPGGENLAKMKTAFEPLALAQVEQQSVALDDLKKNTPPMPELAMAMADGGSPGNVHIFKRGNPGNQGDEAPRRFLLCLTPPTTERPLWTQGSGRLELARAIASKDNPLTARVLVNRVWLHHFGAGIVRTPSDFGKQGERPTHPELLDYLAWQFMQDGWSVKRLHRRILLSSAYRQSSEVTPQKLMVDPENRLVSRMNRRRLDLEQMRDSLLFASGKLDLSQVGGKSIELWGTSYVPRRSVYGFIERQNLPGTFRTFDFASPDSTSAQRFKTNVPQQALFFMNSPFVMDQARLLAAKPEIRTAADDATRVRRLYTALFNRPPAPDETAAALDFLEQNPATGASARRVRDGLEWKYGYGGYDDATQRVTGFTPLAHFGEQGYTVGDKFPDPALGYLMLNAQGGHPGHDGAHAIIRRWVAPRRATVRITGLLKHGQKEGDGVRARIVFSHGGKLGEWIVHNGEAKTESANITVNQGDTIDFVVDPLGGESFDSFTWAPTLSEALQKNGQVVTTTWSAEQEFHGPLPPPPPPLTRTEQYAQALLMTNEFLFVD